ncbi:MAG: heat-inducible transcriptional repressor HrcA [Candidatus Margulisiibacteriota bacterium]
MKTEERQQLILSTLIEEYIDVGEALSSQALAGKAHLNVSSATVRNDLMCLEKEGYVRHLYTSSGRVPTDKGYRFYVNQLRGASPEESLAQKQYFENALSQISVSMDKLLSYSASILSEMTSYPVILVSESLQRNMVKFVQLVLLNIHQVMMVIMNNFGENYEEIIPIYQEKIDQEILNKMTEYLNNLFHDVAVEDLGLIFDQNVEETLSRFGSFDQVLSRISGLLNKSAHRLSTPNVVVENEKKLLTFPEFQDIETLQKILSVLEDEKKICDMFIGGYESPRGGAQSRIGQEHDLPELASTSLVYSDVLVDGQKIASIGLLGPTRMDYCQMMSRINSLLATLGDKVQKLFT